MPGERTIDWEAIEREFRAGQLSIREIARKHELTDGAIRKRAKHDAWQRDLTEAVRKRTQAKLVRETVRTGDARTEREIVESAAQTNIEVVRQHRSSLARLKAIADNLSERLETLLKIPEEVSGKMSGRDLALLADTTDTLSRAIARLVPLERQAFNLDEGASGPVQLTVAYVDTGKDSPGNQD